MSFMAGFAEGFGDQIKAGQERKATKDRDALQMAYSRWEKRDSEYSAAEVKDKQIQDAARQIVNDNGLPEGAWGDVYNRLKHDTFTGAEKWAAGQNWSVAEKTPAMSDTQPPSTPDPQQHQMVESGLTPPPAPEAPAPAASNNPDIIGNVTSTIGQALSNIGNPEAQQQARFSSAENQVRSSTGVSQEEWDQVNNGYQPAAVPPSGLIRTPKEDELTGKAFRDNSYQVFYRDENGNIRQASAIKDAEGNWIDGNKKVIPKDQVERAMTQPDYDNYYQAELAVGTAGAELEVKKNGVMDVAAEAFNLATIVQENPDVLTFAGTASKAIHDGMINMLSLVDAASGVTSPEFQAAEEQFVRAVTDGLPGLGNTVSDFEAYLSQRVKFVFAAAQANNGNRGVLTEKDVERTDAQFGATTAPDFLRQLSGYVTGQVNAVNREAQTTRETSMPIRAADRQGVNFDGLFEPIELPPEYAELFEPSQYGRKPDASTQPKPTEVPSGVSNEAYHIPALSEGQMKELQKETTVDLTPYIGKQIIFDVRDGKMVALDGQGNVIYEK